RGKVPMELPSSTGESHDLRPDGLEGGVEPAACDRLAPFCVCRGQRDSADDLVAVAEASLLLGEADEQRGAAVDGGSPGTEGDIAGRDRRQLGAEQLERSRLPVVAREHDVADALERADLPGERRPAKLVLKIAPRLDDPVVDRRVQAQYGKLDWKQQHEQHS